MITTINDCNSLSLVNELEGDLAGESLRATGEDR